MQKQTILFLLTLLMLLTGCTAREQHYVIGISQCSDDIWREKQNAELRIEAYFQENVELRFAAAYDSDERQVEQIDSLLATGIDLLIVAPNQVQTISPAIDRAYDKGIPVIVFERKTSSQKYTAFISADNHEMGRVMGCYVTGRLQGRGRVLEVKGLEGSSPAIERHQGFVEALQQSPGVELVATLQGDWTEESAYDAVKQWQGDVSAVDFVFAQNDRMAMGARQALLERGMKEDDLPLFCGIDGLPGEQGGIRLVRDSVLAASYIYPTHGDRLIQLAVDILKGRPYSKETKLQSAIVTRDNAAVLLMETEEILRQSDYLDRLHRKADSYLKQLDTQRTVSWLAGGVILLLVVAIVLFYRFHVEQRILRQERVVNALWNMQAPELPAKVESSESSEHSESSESSESSGHSEHSEHSELSELSESPQVDVFIARFKEVVEARLENSETSVEDLAADMHLSRVQLYRRVKSVSGASPVELLRSARLDRAYQLLLKTDKSVSEIAYKVGFTAPSYFTKCFKDKYGQLPGDIRK